MAKNTAGPARKTGTVTEKSAGAVVYFAGERVEYLLLRSRYWEFPKGLVNPDESEEQGAIREVREETSLDISLVPDFRESTDYFYHRKDSTLVKKQVVYFLAEAKTRAFKISWEHQEANWASYEQAMDLLQYASLRELLTRAQERIEQLEK